MIQNPNLCQPHFRLTSEPLSSIIRRKALQGATTTPWRKRPVLMKYVFWWSQRFVGFFMIWRSPNFIGNHIGYIIYPPVNHRSNAKSPFLIGNTSSIRVHFPAILDYRSVSSHNHLEHRVCFPWFPVVNFTPRGRRNHLFVEAYAWQNLTFLDKSR